MEQATQGRTYCTVHRLTRTPHSLVISPVWNGTGMAALQQCPCYGSELFRRVQMSMRPELAAADRFAESPSSFTESLERMLALFSPAWDGHDSSPLLHSSPHFEIYEHL